MRASSRRQFLQSSVIGVAATAASTVSANAQGLAAGAEVSKITVEQVRALQAKELQASTASWNDGLAHPIPFKNPPGRGKDRAIVLGGGSEYMSSFLVGYFHALLSHGVNLRLADIVVGTSAGAVLGSALLGHRLDLFSAEFNLLANYPKVMAKFVPTKASASAPGVTGPTWVKDRVCMDGSIGSTETHCDIVAGSKRVLIVALADTIEQEKEGLRLNRLPNTILQEVKDLETGGTRTKLVVVGMLPGRKTLSVVDPEIMAPAIQYGYERGMQDLPEMKIFWG
jgi:hypothetical protein